jgi:hypothetical protein
VTGTQHGSQGGGIHEGHPPQIELDIAIGKQLLEQRRVQLGGSGDVKLTANLDSTALETELARGDRERGAVVGSPRACKPGDGQRNQGSRLFHIRRARDIRVPKVAK